MTVKEKLINQYSKKSKHSNYQILPKILEPILGQDQVEVKTRYERERLNYILNNLKIQDKSILDIGGNSGFFSFELIDAGARNVHLYEGNKEHCEFVRLAAKVAGIDNLKVTNDYYTFDKHSTRYDIVLLLNVLHHVGDDYDNQKLGIREAKLKIIEQLNSMCTVTDTLVFQLGFNWKGNPKTGLFETGTKKEMIQFIESGVTKNWDIKSIGVAERSGDSLIYNKLSDRNIERDDSLGEFLNRPIFILKAKNSENR